MKIVTIRNMIKYRFTFIKTELHSRLTGTKQYTNQYSSIGLFNFLRNFPAISLTHFTRVPGQENINIFKIDFSHHGSYDVPTRYTDRFP